MFCRQIKTQTPLNGVKNVHESTVESALKYSVATVNEWFSLEQCLSFLMREFK